MNIVFAMGYQPVYAAWQWLYLLIFFMNLMLMIGGLIFNFYRDKPREMPYFLTMLCVPLLFVGIYAPVTYPVIFWLNVELLKQVLVLDAGFYLVAPLISTSLSAFSIWAFWYLFFWSRFLGQFSRSPLVIWGISISNKPRSGGV